MYGKSSYSTVQYVLYRTYDIEHTEHSEMSRRAVEEAAQTRRAELAREARDWVSRAETTPPDKQARPLGHRAKAGVVSVDSC